MRHFILLFLLLFISTPLFSQSINSLNKELKILNQKKNLIDLKIDSLEKGEDSLISRIKDINTTINQIELRKRKETGFKTEISLMGGRLRDKPSVSGNIIVNLEEGDEILIFDWFQKPYFKASYKGKVGYISISSLKENKLIKQVQSKIKQKEFEKIKEQNPKLARLIKEYGQSTAERLIDGKIWIGMSDNMAREALGQPNDINRTTTSYNVHEQWVYPNGKYLYFEDGKLTSWQD